MNLNHLKNITYHLLLWFYSNIHFLFIDHLWLLILFLALILSLIPKKIKNY